MVLAIGIKNLYYDKFLEWQRSNEEAFLNGNWYVTFPGSNRDRIIVGIKNGRCFVVEAAYGSQNVHLFMLFDFYVNINKKQMILYCRLSTHGVEILNLPKSDYLTFENVDLTSFEFIDKENAIVRCRWERQYEMISPYR